MKKIFFPVVIVFMTLTNGCSKKSDHAILSTQSFDTIKSATLLGTWRLTTYTIKTDQMDYQFNGSGISSHALRTLTFKNGYYEAANDDWSGTYEYLEDTSKLTMTPANPGFQPMTLDIDYLLIDQLHLSSPVIDVHPENPNATEYEKFVATQGLSWLDNRNVDISNIRTIKIEFAYYLKHRN